MRKPKVTYIIRNTTESQLVSGREFKIKELPKFKFAYRRGGFGDKDWALTELSGGYTFSTGETFSKMILRKDEILSKYPIEHIESIILKHGGSPATTHIEIPIKIEFI